jgi:TRAP-type C4-dicarboxylate transport system permease small subunit
VSALRRGLDHLYLGAGLLAAACLALLALLVLAQIVGRWFGMMVPAAEDFAGYLLAAASFMALAHTLREGAHIRVNLVTERLPTRLRYRLEGLVLAIGALFALWATWHAGAMVLESWRFGEVASGQLALPLWLPQAPLALGLAVFALALIDAAVAHLRGTRRR